MSTHYAALTWRPRDSKWNGIRVGSSAAQIWRSKNVKLEMLARRAALSSNTLL